MAVVLDTPQEILPEELVARLTADACGSFASDLPPTQVEELARETVNALMAENARVTTFLPVLAMRQLREAVSQRQHS